MFFNSLFGYEARRKRLLKKVPKGALYDFLSVPFPSVDTCLSDLPILSVDFDLAPYGELCKEMVK